MESWIYSILIGGVAGWLAGLVMNGTGLGLIADIIIGIIGGFIGGWLFNLLGISSGGGIIGQVIVSFVGAALLLFIIKQFKK